MDDSASWRPLDRTPADRPIGDYALIGDCHSAALVSSAGAIDWCCLPRFDSDSCFGRLLDPQAGHFSIAPLAECRVRREYLGPSLLLATTFDAGAQGAVRLLDFWCMRRGGRHAPRRELVRIVEGLRGTLRLRVEFSPRLDYGEIRPWLYPLGGCAFVAVGSNTALLLAGDVPLAPAGRHDLAAEIELHAGQRAHLAMRWLPPEELDTVRAEPMNAADVEARLAETQAWWHDWAERLRPDADAAVVRSALVLKALTFAPTGAIVAAPTTSLPEAPGGERNWDYRYSWIRDSAFTVRQLAALGCTAEADAFGRFIQRSAAGSADDLQVLYRVDGKRRLTEIELAHLRGWRGSRPVRIGNAAERQFQSDLYGLLLELAWRWCRRTPDNRPSEAAWDFLVGIVDTAAQRWREPDRGIWEVRSPPRHFVHSKAMCWVALQRGLDLARQLGLPAPVARWQAARDEVRALIESRGVDPVRGCFVAALDGTEVDAALLLLPEAGFVDWNDPRMRRTADAIQEDLMQDGLVLRYRSEDGLHGNEGTFLCCSFWLAECLARQGRSAQARALFDRAAGCANDLGLFAEEFSPALGEPLGNFPQGLTHLAHISAALALA